MSFRHHRARRFLKGLLPIFAITVTVTVCGTDRVVAPLPSSVGTYTLVSAFDQPVPVIYYLSSRNRFVYLSGSLELRADSNFVERMIVRYDDDRATSVTDTMSVQGRFKQLGQRIEFSDPVEGFLFAGSVSDSTVSYVDENMTATYRR